MNHPLSFGQAFLTLFWALFGLGNPSDPRLRHNGTSNATDDGGKGGYLITESFGTMLYMIYYVVMGLVMLNMLIAMMSNSFQEINVSSAFLIIIILDIYIAHIIHPAVCSKRSNITPATLGFSFVLLFHLKLLYKLNILCIYLYVYLHLLCFFVLYKLNILCIYLYTLKTEMLNHHLKGPRSDNSFKMVD